MKEFDKLYRTLSINADNILKHIAVYMEKVDDDNINMLSALFMISNREINKLLMDIEKKSNLLYRDYSSWRRAYRLDEHFSLYLMIKKAEEIKAPSSPHQTKPSLFAEEEKIKAENTLIQAQRLPRNSVREKLMYFLLTNEADDISFERNNWQESDELLLNAMLDFPEFHKVAHLLPIEILNHQFMEELSQVFFYLNTPEGAEKYYALLAKSRLITKEKLQEYTDSMIAIRHLLTGQLDEIPTQASRLTSIGLCLHAYYHHSKGEMETAISLYEKALKLFLGPRKPPLPLEPIFSFSYALALSESKNPKHSEKAYKLLKKKELQELTYKIPRLLFSMKEGMEKEALQSMFFEASFYEAPLMIQLLGITIASHYEIPIPEKIGSDPFFLTLLKQIPYKRLQLECAISNPLLKEWHDSLSKELKYPSLLSSSKKEEEWERVLNTLITKDFGGSESTQKSSETGSRVAYLINSKQNYIQPILQKSKGGDKWTNGRKIALSRLATKTMPEMNEVDMRVAGCIKRYDSYSGHEYLLSYEQAMSCLIGHPHVLLEKNPEVAVEIVAMNPELTIFKTKNGYKLELNIRNLSCLTQIIPENDTRIKVLKLSAKQFELLQLLNRFSLFPFEAEEKLMQLLQRIGSLITIHSDLINTDESLKKVIGDSRTVVQLIPIGNGLKAELFVKPFTTEPPYCKAGVGAKSVIGTIEGKKCQAMRDFKTEKTARELIHNLFLEMSDENADDSVLFEDPYQCLELLDKLRNYANTTLVEWPEGVRFRITHQADFKNLNISLQSKNNWFEMEGELKIGKETFMSVKELLDGVRSSRGRFIQMNNGDFLALSEQLRKQLADLDALVSTEKGKMIIQPFATFGLDKLDGLGAFIEGDRNYKLLKEKISKADKKTYPIPKKLKANLREYQEEGFRWMARLNEWGAGACLADDMGLGKTVQAIGMLLYTAQQGASLVTAPASVLLNWKMEIERFAPSLNILLINGPAGNNRTEIIEKADAHDVILTTYGLLVTEEAVLTSKNWNMVILDEGHTIKNKDTKMSKTAMQLNAHFRLLLTGTPIQNHLGEIWNLYQFINPGLLGSFEQFNTRFIQPIVQYEDKVQQRRLKKLISPFLLRRTKSEVLEELPPKTEIIKEVELSEAEMTCYELMRRETELSLEAGVMSPVQTLAEITKLRQAACNINLVNKKLPMKSSKLEAFLSIVEELQANNHRALVFSQFTSHLALMRAALDEQGVTYLYLDGSTPIPERAKLVKNFQTGDQPLFLISLKAGGLGLNLTAADFIIHMDPWWNPAIEDQASDRAHRIGQNRPVTVYRLIAQHTIEEKIIRLHASKKDLADSLLEGSNLAHKLTKEELLELLRG